VEVKVVKALNYRCYTSYKLFTSLFCSNCTNFEVLKKSYTRLTFC